MVSGHHCPRCRPCRGIQGMLLWSDAQPDKWKQNGLKALGDNLESELEWISPVCTHSGKGEWREGHRFFGLLSHSDARLSTDLIHGLPLWGMRKQGGDTHRVLCRTRTQPKVGHILGLHRTIVCSFVWLVEGRSKCRYAHHFRGSSSPAKVEGLDWFFCCLFPVLPARDSL